MHVPQLLVEYRCSDEDHPVFKINYKMGKLVREGRNWEITIGQTFDDSNNLFVAEDINSALRWLIKHYIRHRWYNIQQKHNKHKTKYKH